MSSTTRARTSRSRGSDTTSSSTPQVTALCHTFGAHSPPRGTLVIGGGEGGGRWFGVGRQLRALVLSPFVSQKLGTFIAKQNSEALVSLKELIEAGKVTPVIGSTYPLSEVPEAIRHLGDGHGRGKVVIRV